jgi:hypothetical protein
MLVAGCGLDKARDRMATEDSEDAAAALIERGGETEFSSSKGKGGGSASSSILPEVDDEEEGEEENEEELQPPPARCCVRVMHSRGCVLLGFHHLTTLSFEFWCHLVSITLYGGSYFTFLGEKQRERLNRLWVRGLWMMCHFGALRSLLLYSRAAFGNDVLQSKYGYDSSQSGALVGIVSLSSVVLSPASGLLLDK